MKRTYFSQFICKPLKIGVISRVIPILSAIMICTQFTPALCADFTGNWSGAWMSSYGKGSGGLSGNITQTGTNLTGTMTVTNTGCGTFSNVPFTGSVSGDVATLQGTVTCSQDGSSTVLEFTNGTILGNSITGLYTTYRNGSPHDSGSFSLTRSSAPLADWTDMWWNPSESGWGVNIADQNGVLFILLYLYGQDGNPRWYSGAVFQTSINSFGYSIYQGDLISTTGPWFDDPFNPQAVNRQKVGTLTFSPSTPDSAQLSYSVNGINVSKQIERFIFH
jgi:hypothetical protein